MLRCVNSLFYSSNFAILTVLFIHCNLYGGIYTSVEDLGGNRSSEEECMKF